MRMLSSQRIQISRTVLDTMGSWDRWITIELLVVKGLRGFFGIPTWIFEKRPLFSRIRKTDSTVQGSDTHITGFQFPRRNLFQLGRAVPFKFFFYSFLRHMPMSNFKFIYKFYYDIPSLNEIFPGKVSISFYM